MHPLHTVQPLDERSMAAKARLVCRCGPPRACSLYADWPFFLRDPQVAMSKQTRKLSKWSRHELLLSIFAYEFMHS